MIQARIGCQMLGQCPEYAANLCEKYVELGPSRHIILSPHQSLQRQPVQTGHGEKAQEARARGYRFSPRHEAFGNRPRE